MPETTMHLRIPSREVAEHMALALTFYLFDAKAPNRETRDALSRLVDALDACPADVTPMTRRELVEQVEDLRGHREHVESKAPPPPPPPPPPDYDVSGLIDGSLWRRRKA